MYLIKNIFNNKYLFSLLIVLFGGFCWVFFNGFDITNIEKGYDPFRYMDHAVNGCFYRMEICTSPIVNLLRMLGNNSIIIYINFLILIFCLLTISISKDIFPYLKVTTPILLYYLPQTGKDSFTIIGSLSLLSLLIEFSSKRKFINMRNFTIARNFPLTFLRISVLLFSIYLRSEVIILFSVLIYIFFTYRDFKKNKFIYNFFRISFTVIIVIYTSLRLEISNADGLWLINYLRDYDGVSNFATGRYSFLIGTSQINYFSRLIFYFFYPFILPFVFLNRLTQLINLGSGYTYIYFISIFLQNILIFRYKLITRFLYISFPYIAVISIFIFPHLRYYLILFPALLILAQIQNDKFNVLKN